MWTYHKHREWSSVVKPSGYYIQDEYGTVLADSVPTLEHAKILATAYESLAFLLEIVEGSASRDPEIISRAKTLIEQATGRKPCQK